MAARGGETATADQEISATRVFDAPLDLVWQVRTDPKHIAQWWGPNGFTNTIHEMTWGRAASRGAVEGLSQTLGRLAEYLARR